MLLTFLILMFFGMISIFLTPLVLLTITWNSIIAGISGFTAWLTIPLSTVSNFVELSTVATCVGVILGLELLIKAWELFSTFILRK